MSRRARPTKAEAERAVQSARRRRGSARLPYKAAAAAPRLPWKSLPDVWPPEQWCARRPPARLSEGMLLRCVREGTRSPRGSVRRRLPAGVREGLVHDLPLAVNTRQREEVGERQRAPEAGLLDRRGCRISNLLEGHDP